MESKVLIVTSSFNVKILALEINNRELEKGNVKRKETQESEAI